MIAMSWPRNPTGQPAHAQTLIRLDVRASPLAIAALQAF